ncbi:MAG: hypothetical protein K9K78_04485 [Spirochaetales bacterium]|nr:hypothetical protein [Spirochaetales bacterium]
MNFYTAIMCMDGRIQLPVHTYVHNHFKVDAVDTVTEAGPERFLAFPQVLEYREKLESIRERVLISLEKHASQGIVVVGHYDCAGNPAEEEERKQQVLRALTELRQLLGEQYRNTPITALWVDSRWRVQKLT